MKEIIFIADIFSDALNGGAENNDSVLIDYLQENNFSVEKVKSYELTKDIIEKNDTFLIGNFIGLSEENKGLLKTKKYIIYEHDHKYVTTRDPSRFKDFLIPKKEIINLDFYKNAHAVVVLSEICKQIMVKNLNLKNIHNIGCSLWSDEKLELIRSLCSEEKYDKFVILNSNNPIKNTKLAVDYCKMNKVNFAVLSQVEEEIFLQMLALYRGLVFFPGVLETFSRVCAEAKMLNCKLLTKPNLIGFASEDIFSLSGEPLIDEMKKRNASALKLFNELLC